MTRRIVRELRRPIVLTAISAVCLVLQHVLLRVMAHAHVAHVLLGAGNAPPPSGAGALAVTLVIARLVSFVLVPGLVLAAAAETIAYLLVGPANRMDAAPPEAESR